MTLTHCWPLLWGSASLGAATHTHTHTRTPVLREVEDYEAERKQAERGRQHKDPERGGNKGCGEEGEEVAGCTPPPPNALLLFFRISFFFLLSFPVSSRGVCFYIWMNSDAKKKKKYRYWKRNSTVWIHIDIHSIPLHPPPPSPSFYSNLPQPLPLP